MQETIISTRFFSWISAHGILLQLKKRWKEIFRFQQPTLYNTIHSLPLNIFIACICDADFSGLVIKGKPKPELLAKAWDEILDEYLFSVSDTKDKYLMNLTRDIYLLQYDITRVAAIQKYLFYRYKKEFVDELILMGVVTSQVPEDTDKLIAWFNQITGCLKRWINLLEQKKAELKKNQPEGAGAMDRKYFNDTLTNLSRFVGYHLSEKELTVGRYISVLQQCREQIKKAEADLNKIKK
jgi:hypothetical protein